MLQDSRVKTFEQFVTVGQLIEPLVIEASSRPQWRNSEKVELGYGAYLSCDSGLIRINQLKVHHETITLAILYPEGWQWRDIPGLLKKFDEVVYARMNERGECLCLACRRARKARNKRSHT